MAIIKHRCHVGEKQNERYRGETIRISKIASLTPDPPDKSSKNFFRALGLGVKNLGSSMTPVPVTAQSLSLDGILWKTKAGCEAMDDLPDINDPLWLSPLSDAQLEDIARIEARHQEWRGKEAVEILVKVRHEVGNAFVALDLVVLHPVCDNCASQIIESSPVNIVRVWPELADGRLRLYDRGDHSLYFFEDEVSDAPGYAIQCHLVANQLLR